MEYVYLIHGHKYSLVETTKSEDYLAIFPHKSGMSDDT
jgi:hypothetical protein